MSWGENLPGERLKIGLALRLLDEVVPNDSSLNLRGEACRPHSSANLWRLGLSGLVAAVSCGSNTDWQVVRWVVSSGTGENLRFVFTVVSTGSGANLRLVFTVVFTVVSTGSGANLRFVFTKVSRGSGENLRRFVFTVVSTGSGANLRFVFVVVSTGSGANLRTGLGLSASSSAFLFLEDDVDVSIGSILKRLGPPVEAILLSSPDKELFKLRAVPIIGATSVDRRD
jgi:hypothetical protein